MKKVIISFLFFYLVSSILIGQNCVYVFETTSFFCFSDPNRQSGDIIQMTYEDFTNENVINALIQEGDDFCDERSRIKIIRRLKEETTSHTVKARNSSVDCREKLVFAGFSPCVPSAPCNDSLVLFVEISGNPLGFNVPPSATVPCSYDMLNDPNGLIGFPTNIKGGKISFFDNITATDCSSQVTITRTWTITSCNSGSINKVQTITILPANCSYNESIYFSIPIPTGSYTANGVLLSDGSVPSGHKVGLFGKDGVTLEAGFHAETNSDFTAAIGTCTVVPSNDICSLPTQLSCGDLMVGSTQNATNSTTTNLANTCTTSDPFLNTNLDAGVFFSYKGAGKPIKISTDHVFTNFDTELRVYTGDCNNNSCLIGNDDIIAIVNARSEIIFLAEEGTNYLIYLDGYNGAIGNFGISLECFEGDIVIPCGDPVFATTSQEKNQFINQDYYNGACNPFSLFDGNDKSFLLNITDTSDYTITMFELQADLDLFLVSLNADFSINQCLAESRFGEANDEMFTVNLIPGQYAVIADGPNDMIESCFMLEVTCTASLMTKEDAPKQKLLVKESENKQEINAELPIKNKSIRSLDLKVYPNPTNSNTTVSYFLPNTEDVGLQLLNLNGQVLEELQHKILQTKGHYQYSLDVSHYSSGVYLISLQTNFNNKYQKIVIQ